MAGNSLSLLALLKMIWIKYASLKFTRRNLITYRHQSSRHDHHHDLARLPHALTT